jgi:transposase
LARTRGRRSKGKSDPIDAIAAARAALSGTANGIPKARTGPVEAIRALRVARRGAIKARTAALNQLHGLVAAAPEPLRADLTGLPTAACQPVEWVISDPLHHVAYESHALLRQRWQRPRRRQRRRRTATHREPRRPADASGSPRQPSGHCSK